MKHYAQMHLPPSLEPLRIPMINHQLVPLMRRLIVWVVPIVLLLLLPTAQASQAMVDSPQAFVKTTINKVIDTLRSHEQHNLTPDELHQVISDQIRSHFDLTRMSRLVLGKHWRKATKEQQKQFVDQFWKLLVRTYATVLNQYTNKNIEVLQPIKRDKGRVYVPILATRSGSAPVETVYKIRLQDDSWKVYDVTVSGISLVKNYRASFVSVVRRESMDSLITRITKMNK